MAAASSGSGPLQEVPDTDVLQHLLPVPDCGHLCLVLRRDGSAKLVHHWSGEKLQLSGHGLGFSDCSLISWHH